jgi:hypothetical protein
MVKNDNRWFNCVTFKQDRCLHKEIKERDFLLQEKRTYEDIDTQSLPEFEEALDQLQILNAELPLSFSLKSSSSTSVPPQLCWNKIQIIMFILRRIFGIIWSDYRGNVYPFWRGIFIRITVEFLSGLVWNIHDGGAEAVKASGVAGYPDRSVWKKLEMSLNMVYNWDSFGGDIMKLLSVRDLKTKSSQVWKDLLDQKEMVITSNGRPIAILSSVNENNLEQVLSAFRQARAIEAVTSMQYDSVLKGKDKITLEEINNEIKIVRSKRKR